MQKNFQNPAGKKTIHLQENEKMEIFLEDFSENSADFQLEIKLEGDRAECAVFGRMQSFGTHKKSWRVTQQFLGKNQKGSINLHGVAEDQSLLEFDGAGVLENSSQKAEININEKILLFGKARGKSLPVLTVKTDDVKKAQHAAKITPISDDLLFYCESKGLSRKDSEELLKKGFLNLGLAY